MDEIKNTTSNEEIKNVDAPVVEEINDETGEVVTTETKEPAPKLKTNPDGTYHGIFLPPMNHLARITKVLTEEAGHNEELAKAIAEGKESGKKTIEGCNRYILNNMKDLAREMKANEITYDGESIKMIAIWYMLNPDVKDAQNVTKAVKAVKQAKEKKPKAEKKAEPKPKAEEKKAKKVPLTPQMGDLFGSFFDDDNNNEDDKEK